MVALFLWVALTASNLSEKPLEDKSTLGVELQLPAVKGYRH